MFRVITTLVKIIWYIRRLPFSLLTSSWLFWFCRPGTDIPRFDAQVRFTRYKRNIQNIYFPHYHVVDRRQAQIQEFFGARRSIPIQTFHSDVDSRCNYIH